MGSYLCLHFSHSFSKLSTLHRTANSLLSKSSSFFQHHRCSYSDRVVSASIDARELRSTDLVALEYADLNLPYKDSGLVKRAEFWVKELALGNIHFMFANATVSFKQLVSTYPGPLVLVSILCPDPHFKKRHHKRRVVQKPLVDSIVKSLMHGGKVFVQSDVLEVALDLRNQFDAELDALQHIDTIDPSVPCNEEGWLLNNPMGIRTEREIHAEFEGAKIYRRMYQKRYDSGMEVNSFDRFTLREAYLSNSCPSSLQERKTRDGGAASTLSGAAMVSRLLVGSVAKLGLLSAATITTGEVAATSGWEGVGAVAYARDSWRGARPGITCTVVLGEEWA
ncbi:hypothetical protein EZV62_007764 [Acer yangbiense]|uniref:tRNA (guanine(46)-N(7))-methyltransferase n=1 Tax=Acer yangbiense TaxID=1000413 RepID=A0A5C7ICB7_9ROSI|nr:hypothetical protein EZV62_007764 [Acer yangbiense]